MTLIQPGAGHIVLGQFRRGTAWVLGLATVVIVLFFAIPFNLLTIVGAFAVGTLGRIACAIDTARTVGRRPRWVLVGLGWVALIVVGLLMEQVAHYYRANYAQAFTIPSGAMRDTLLVGDYIMADRAVYRRQAPGRGESSSFAIRRMNAATSSSGSSGCPVRHCGCGAGRC